MKYAHTKKIKSKRKYKNKNKTKKSNETKKAKNTNKKIIIGGTISSSKKKSSTLPQRKSSHPGKKSSVSTSFKTPRRTIVEKIKKSKEKEKIEQQMEMEIETLIKSFFENLKISHFPEALCALYKLYTLFPYDKLKTKIYSSDFKKKYEDAFYIQKNKINSFGVMHCDLQAKNNYIYFLSYVFKKIADGASITCDGKELPFLYSIDKSNPSILTILKQFLGYLDTACVTTISYTISSEKYDLYYQILQGLQPASRYSELTHAEIALAQIIYSLNRLIPLFPSLQDILDNIVTHNLEDGTIANYSMNTTVLSRIIKQSYTDFLQTIPEEIREIEAEEEIDGKTEGQGKVTIIEEVD